MRRMRKTWTLSLSLSSFRCPRSGRQSVASASTLSLHGGGKGERERGGDVGAVCVTRRGREEERKKRKKKKRGTNDGLVWVG